MTGRERVKRAIHFQTPDRIPFWQHITQAVPDDICDCDEMDRQKAGWFFDNPNSYDDWGCRWADGGTNNMGQVVGHPISLEEQEIHIQIPNPADPYYFERLGKQLEMAGDRYRLVNCHFGLLERTHMLCGFADTLMALYSEPEEIIPIIDTVLEFKLRHLKELHDRFGSEVDGIFWTDDWGSQQNALIGDDVFREIFLPRYRRLNDAIHSYGWDIILHSCGRTRLLIPALIDSGFDALNIQVFDEDIEEIGEITKDRIALVIMTDYQRILPFGTSQQIVDQTRKIVQHWNHPNGGLVALCFGDLDQMAVPEEGALLMLKTFAEGFEC